MALPKAILCIFGAYDGQHEEAALRRSGFATACLRWDELERDNAWMELPSILDDPAIVAWVFAGEPGEYTEDMRIKTSLVSLALTRERQPATAVVFCEAGDRPNMPPLLAHVALYHSLDPFAAKLMAARFKEAKPPYRPFHMRAHTGPLLGLWLEAGPPEGTDMEGFMLGVLEADITAFGEGPRGALPSKSILAYPMLGVKGELGGRPFCACAAQNMLGGGNACYCKIDGLPRGVFLGPYADDEGMVATVRLC
jgi:hypothetical protein